jgi:hypothetical protein
MDINAGDKTIIRDLAKSDHSVSSGVTPESYAYMAELIREYGTYPLDMDRITQELAELNAKLGK